MLAAALAQIPHVVAGDGRAYEDCDQEMLLVPATTNRLLNPLSVACGSVTRAVPRRNSPLAIKSWRAGVIFQLYRLGRNSPNL
jgi:hypothetical protein